MKSRIGASLFLCCLLFVSPALAGWVSQESKTAVDLNGISFYNGSVGYTAGAGGTVAKSADGGLNWALKASGASQEVLTVLAINATELYLCGSDGLLKRSTDIGETYADFFALSADLQHATIMTASAAGARRAFAAYNNWPGTTWGSHLISSTDHGGSWAEVPVAALVINGVHLSSAETWVWGRDTVSNNYVLRRGTLEVWSDAARQLRALSMVDANTGYAVGTGGLLLKTTSGGGSGQWSAVTSGTASDLNDVKFLTPDFGWAVGANGTILVTATGGATWSAYTLDDPTAEVRSLTVFVESIGPATSVVHAFVCGERGRVYKLASPSITQVTPEALSQGYIGTLEVVGNGFIEGAQLAFLSGGTVDPGLTVIYASYESSTRIRAQIIVSAEAAPGWRDVQVTNPDATTSIESSALLVTTAEAVIRNIWLDGTKYNEYWRTSEKLAVNSSPRIKFEAFSNAGLDPALMETMIVARQGNDFQAFFPAAADLTAVSTRQVNVDTRAVTGLRTGAKVVFYFYVKDLAGDAGGAEARGQVVTAVASPGATPAPGSTTGKGSVYPNKTQVNLLKEGALIQYRPLDGTVIDNLRVILTDWKGMKVWEKTFQSQGALNKFNFLIPPAELPPALSAGIYVVLVFNADNMQLLAKNKISCVPWQ